MEKKTVNSCRNPISMKPSTEVSISSEVKIGDNGLCKKVLKKGVSWQMPVPGDEVEVHYNVRHQEGEYFDSSRDKGTTFRFKLGQCEVIKGWDEGIATMRKGERAIFTVPPELAYGETGCGLLIPPNSTLIFDVELLRWYPIRDVSGDGGILKKIVREGEGWATPNQEDEVLVKYVAKDEGGSVISMSDQGLEFCVASGHLCPAMSKAVKTMRKGEKVELSVKLFYGLQNCGNGSSTIDDINPTHKNLMIDLELLSWRNVVDVNGDKKILKKIMKIGEDFDRPHDGSLVKVMYICKLEDGTVVERQGSQEQPFSYVCGEEQIHGGLDKAVMTMKKGEEALVKISSESLRFEIKLVDFIKEKPFWKMDAREKLKACETKKHEGNVLFREGKFQLAAKKYDKATKYIEYNHSFSEEDKNGAKLLRLWCYLNEAACKLELGEYKEVSRLCTKVLELDPYNVKALFRRAQAYIRTSDLEKAEEDLIRALLIDPTNKDLKMKEKELRDLQRQYIKHEAKIFSTMISRIS